MKVQMYLQASDSTPMEMDDNKPIRMYIDTIQTIVMELTEAVIVFVLGDSADNYIVTSNGDYILMGG